MHQRPTSYRFCLAWSLAGVLYGPWGQAQPNGQSAPSVATPPAPSPSQAAAAPQTAPIAQAPAAAEGPQSGAVETMLKNAQAAAAAAQEAPTPAESKVQAQQAQASANQVNADQAATPAQKASATAAAKTAQQSATQKQQASDSLCGPSDTTSQTPRSFCFVYGMFAASLSFVNVTGEGNGTGSVFSGQSNHHLTSVAVPFAGIRFLPQLWAGATNWGFVSIDIAGYSAFLTQNLGSTTPSTTKVSCSSAGSDFTMRLPCEANASVQPYVGAYAGITIGKSGLAYVSFIPFTLGIAQVGTSSGLRGYTGWSVGALQINGSL